MGKEKENYNVLEVEPESEHRDWRYKFEKPWRPCLRIIAKKPNKK